MTKFVQANPLSDPEAAARKLVEIANGVEAVQDGRIHIEKINGPFLFKIKGTPAQYGAGIRHAIERGWIVMHESGTFHSGRRGSVRVVATIEQLEISRKNGNRYSPRTWMGAENGPDITSVSSG